MGFSTSTHSPALLLVTPLDLALPEVMSQRRSLGSKLQHLPSSAAYFSHTACEAAAVDIPRGGALGNNSSRNGRDGRRHGRIGCRDGWTDGRKDGQSQWLGCRAYSNKKAIETIKMNKDKSKQNANR